jgi:hypothetical protein
MVAWLSPVAAAFCVRDSGPALRCGDKTRPRLLRLTFSLSPTGPAKSAFLRLTSFA